MPKVEKAPKAARSTDEVLEIPMCRVILTDPALTFKPETVEWLWERRIPKGKVTARDGDPGTGKSLSLYDLGARITSGNPMPDSHHTQRAGALIISAEDGAAGTIVPRFLRAGGASKQARIMGNDRLFVSPDGLDKLERAISAGRSLVCGYRPHYVLPLRRC